MTKSCPQPQGLDLTQVPAVRGLIRWRGFPTAFQLLTLLTFVFFLVLGWGHFAPQGVSSKLYAKSNLVNLVIWGLWWPAMVWVAVLFGRAWCAVCPLELVADRSERAGVHLGVKQRTLSPWLRSGWLIVVLYFVIQLLVAGAGMHRTPAYTSWFLLGLLLMAVLAGLFFRNRAYCRGFCPVGLLLGTYGRGSMLAVRAAHNPAAGRVQAPEGLQQVARSCPSLLNPPKLDSSKDCLICGACVRASQHDEMTMVLRRPFHEADSRETLASWPVTLFVVLVSGFVTYEMTTNWPAGKALFLSVPSSAAGFLGLSSSNGWVAGLWMLLVFPTLLWLVLGGLARISGGASSLGSAWRRLALPATVIVAAGHLAKGLEKLATWGGYLPRALGEPLGVQASLAYSTNALTKPAHLLSMEVLSGAGLILLLLALWLGVRELRLADSQGYRRRILPLLLLWGVFTFCVARWGVWP